MMYDVCFIPVEDRIATFDMDGTFIKTTSSPVLRKTSYLASLERFISAKYFHSGAACRA